MAHPFLSIVVPAHNEATLLDLTIRDLREGLALRRERSILEGYEILVVENGSTDETLAKASALARGHDDIAVRSLPRANYGGALRTGVLTARGDLVACFDADYYDLDFLDAAINALASADLVIGSKRAPGSVDTRRWPRRLVTAVFAAVLHLGFGVDLSDTHGMKVMRRDAVADLAARCRFEADLFDTELVVRAVRAGRRVVELPVVVTERRPPRTSIWMRAPRALVGLVRLRIALANETNEGR